LKIEAQREKGERTRRREGLSWKGKKLMHRGSVSCREGAVLDLFL